MGARFYQCKPSSATKKVHSYKMVYVCSRQAAKVGEDIFFRYTTVWSFTGCDFRRRIQALFVVPPSTEKHEIKNWLLKNQSLS